MISNNVYRIVLGLPQTMENNEFLKTSLQCIGLPCPINHITEDLQQED